MFETLRNLVNSENRVSAMARNQQRENFSAEVHLQNHKLFFIRVSFRFSLSLETSCSGRLWYLTSADVANFEDLHFLFILFPISFFTLQCRLRNSKPFASIRKRKIYLSFIEKVKTIQLKSPTICTLFPHVFLLGSDIGMPLN